MAHRRIVLLRHGIAEDREAWKGPDLERPLTPRGLKRTRAAARGLRVLGIAPDLILTSPAVRARQTAELAARVLGVRRKALHEEDALRPNGKPEEVLEVLGALEVSELLCVGHAPLLDQVLAALLGLKRLPPELALGKSGAALVAVRPRAPTRGTLEAWLAPRQLRQLGRRA